jgi:hypothetical protein
VKKTRFFFFGVRILIAVPYYQVVAQPASHTPESHDLMGAMYRCNGVVTNIPCNEGIILFPEVQRKTPSPRKKTPDKNADALAQLRAAVGELRRNYNFRGDIRGVEAICAESSLLICEKRASEREKELRDMALKEYKVRRAGKKSSTLPSPHDKGTSITIVQPQLIPLDNHPNRDLHAPTFTLPHHHHHEHTHTPSPPLLQSSPSVFPTVTSPLIGGVTVPFGTSQGSRRR